MPAKGNGTSRFTSAEPTVGLLARAHRHGEIVAGSALQRVALLIHDEHGIRSDGQVAEEEGAVGDRHFGQLLQDDPDA